MPTAANRGSSLPPAPSLSDSQCPTPRRRRTRPLETAKPTASQSTSASLRYETLPPVRLPSLSASARIITELDEYMSPKTGRILPQTGQKTGRIFQERQADGLWRPGQRSQCLANGGRQSRQGGSVGNMLARCGIDGFAGLTVA